MIRTAARLVLPAALAVALAASCAPAPPILQAPALGSITKVTEIAEPILPETSDPSVVQVDGEYFVYGSDNHLRAPVTRVADLDTPLNWFEKFLVTTEAMPDRPAWAARDDQLWAPTVGRFGDRWIMYFAADRVNPPQPHNAQCIGRAFAAAPDGPFVAEAKPWHCGLRGVGGALDPELFTDASGNRWVHAAFSDTETPIHAILLDDAGNRVVDAIPILDRQHPWEHHFLEQPAMVYDPSQDNYVLTYSAGRWYEAGYSTGIARCATPFGPCTSDPRGPWMASSAGRSGPGGLSFFTDADGATRAIFATFQAGLETTLGGRSASVMDLELTPRPRLVAGTATP